MKQMQKLASSIEKIETSARAGPGTGRRPAGRSTNPSTAASHGLRSKAHAAGPSGRRPRPPTSPAHDLRADVASRLPAAIGQGQSPTGRHTATVGEAPTPGRSGDL